MRKIKKLYFFIIDYIKAVLFNDCYKDIDLSNKLPRSITKNKINLPYIEPLIINEYESVIFDKYSDALGGCWRTINKEKNNNSSLNILFLTGYSNYKKFKKINAMISFDYKKINWHKDAISGKSLQNIRHHFIRSKLYINKLEIKYMWEISRFHEMLTLGILFEQTNNEKYIIEYRNRFFDFYSNNPVGYGPNWVCAMEVSIRIINLIYSLNFTHKHLDENTLDEINIFINESYIFIQNNLENKHEVNNHYLSNIVALLMIESLYKIKGIENTEIIFIDLIKEQFNRDGSNFESSTSYHCLSFELFKIGYSCLHCKNELNDLLYQSASFVDWFYYSDVNKFRIGDDDSGKIIKTIYDYITIDKTQSIIPIEGVSKIKKISIAEIFSRDKYISNRYFDNLLINEKITFAKQKNNKQEEFINNQLPSIISDMKCTWDYKFKNKREFEFEFEFNYFDVFGVFFIKFENVAIAFRTHGRTCGHRHDDSLHVDIFIEGELSILDSGSVNYTYKPSIRDYLRSSQAHNVPYSRIMDSSDLFKYPFNDTVKFEFFNSDREMILYAEIKSLNVKRVIKVNIDGIYIYDSNLDNNPINKNINILVKSNFYGSVNDEESFNYLSKL